MKVMALVTVAALIVPAGNVLAQAGEMKGMDMKSAPATKAQATAHKATGVVKKVDPAKGTVTLAHGPVKDLNWPAMTMAFAVKDKSLYDKLAVDKTIEFEFVQKGSNYVVTAVK
jgi:Cu(I)/Ag(I) efflux system protein CusF